MPTGPLWLHEIKHDGYRIVASKSDNQVRLWSRNGRDWSRAFLAVSEALHGLRVLILSASGVKPVASLAGALLAAGQRPEGQQGEP